MDKLGHYLDALVFIDRCIRDPNYVATQEAIARDLGVSARTVRKYFDKFKEIGAPIDIEGKYCNGWIYFAEWDLWEALREWRESTK